MIRAVLFDFNGVIVDDEPIHFQLFQKVLKEEGFSLTKEDYYSKYLGMDDLDCFKTAIEDQKGKADLQKIEAMIQRKSRYYEEIIKSSPPFVPGALEVIKALAKTHFLAVVSGALRREIQMALKAGGVESQFNCVIAAEDIEHGKPNPEGFEKAFLTINRDHVASSEMLLPVECLVIEDSIWGIDAAKAAGMPVIGVTTSFKEAELPGALLYLKDFSKVDVEKLLQTVAGKIPA